MVISCEGKMAEGESQRRGVGMVLLTLRTLFSGSICNYVMSKTKQPLYSQPFNKNSNNCFKQWILHHKYNVWSGYGGMFMPVLTTTKNTSNYSPLQPSFPLGDRDIFFSLHLKESNTCS